MVQMAFGAARRFMLGMALSACSLASGSACADWEFTHWEMSRPALWQAGKPYGITLATGPQDQYECSNSFASVVYKAPYKLGDFEATACLLFDRNTYLFREVHIPLADPSQKQHVAELITAKYGQPFRTSSLIENILTETVWLAETDRITLTYGVTWASLRFERPISETGDGW
jgi:hypothetical protein